MSVSEFLPYDVPEPDHLVLQCHIGVVKDNGIPGLPQRRGLPVGVDVVPGLEIVQDGFQIRVRAGGPHFLEPSHRPDIDICNHENLQIGIRKYGCADIASVHHHSSGLAVVPKNPVHEIPDLGDDGYRAYVS